jgi:hypothetical protein
MPSQTSSNRTIAASADHCKGDRPVQVTHDLSAWLDEALAMMKKAFRDGEDR